MFIFGCWSKSIFWGIYFGELVLSNLLENIDQYSITPSLFKNFGAWKLPGSELVKAILWLFCLRVRETCYCLLCWLNCQCHGTRAWMKWVQTYLTRKNCCNYLHASKVILTNIWRYLIYLIYLTRKIFDIFDKKNCCNYHVTKVIVRQIWRYLKQVNHIFKLFKFYHV